MHSQSNAISFLKMLNKHVSSTPIVAAARHAVADVLRGRFFYLEAQLIFGSDIFTSVRL